MITNVAADNELKFSININSDIFSQYERLRIDGVKAVFKGAKSANGIIQVYVESTGISEDRYQGKCFKFMGEKWNRGLSYYSHDVVKGAKLFTVDQIKIALMTALKEQGVYIDSGDIHKSFAGVFQTPTAFFTWIFSIPKNKNPGLDLSNLYEIELNFPVVLWCPFNLHYPYQCKVEEEAENEEAQSQGKSQVNISTNQQKVKSTEY